MRIWCQRSCQPRGHGVGVVIDYADTDKTILTLSKSFEYFSPILKEQSGEKGIYMCLHSQ